MIQQEVMMEVRTIEVDARWVHRNVTIEEVGDTAAFLCSDLASGITGEVVYVDAGYHTAGLMGNTKE